MNFDKLKYNQENVKKGDLLLSEPFLNDPNFMRTVILICEENEDGFFGLTLNKKIEEVKLSDVLSISGHLHENLYLGGPVEQNMLQYIHTYGDVIPNSLPVVGNLCFGGDFDVLLSLIDQGEIDKKQVRFFLGYSGWAKGQLEVELKDNTWITTNSSEYDIFALDPEDLWRLILTEMGGDFKMLSNFPIDPRLN